MTHSIDFDAVKGLSYGEVSKRLAQEGYNELPQDQERGYLSLLLSLVQEPILLLLIGAGLVYFLLGDIQEALLLLLFVFIVIGITVYQEHKTERALSALRQLSSPRALVIRDNKRTRIPGREVVRGDFVLLTEGDRVPADARVLASTNLLVDEAILTGESIPVRKFPWDGKLESVRPGGEDQPFVFSGTLVVQGRGLAEVIATGPRTEFGKIGKTLGETKRRDTRLRQETARLVRDIALVGFAICIIIVVVFGLSRQDWLGGLLAGITLAMAILPEEFPVVLTVFLALGAWRIAKMHVLTREVSAIESLGAATVLCVDKTGTITENKMSVSAIVTDGLRCDISGKQTSTIPDYCHEVLEFAILASKKDPFDPMEQALHHLGRAGLAGTEHLHKDWVLVEEYPLSKELLAMSNVWRSPDGVDFVIAAKGAPEAIGDLCHLTKDETGKLHNHVLKLAEDGLRVIGIGKSYFRAGNLPAGQHDFSFKFLGLMGFADPVRPEVPDSVRECQSAGIRVIIITGDYPATAQRVALHIGLEGSDEIITGQELNDMREEDLLKKIDKVSIFARAVPEQKLRIVNALKGTQHIVAMTGDGVNDAPALKAADIGIAMGERGTDVAREAASLVLLNDDFSSIVKAVGMGRRIFDNLRKAVAYIVAIHIPIAGISLFPVLLGWPLILLPIHIVFLELIIDPACSIVFEAEEADPNVMKRPPRNKDEPLFHRNTLLLSFLQGGVILGILLLMYWFFSQSLTTEEARALTFSTLVVANLGLIIVNRSWTESLLKSIQRPNRALWYVIGAALFFLFLVLRIPTLRAVFKFGILDGMDIGLVLMTGIFAMVLFEAIKKVVYSRKSVIAPAFD